MNEPETLTENVQDYVETRIDLIKLRAIDKASAAVTGTIVGIASVIIGFIVLMLLSFSAAYAIGELTERTSIGFLIVGGFYLLLILLVNVFKEKLITVPVINALMKRLYFDQPGEGANDTKTKT